MGKNNRIENLFSAGTLSLGGNHTPLGYLIDEQSDTLRMAGIVSDLLLSFETMFTKLSRDHQAQRIAAPAVIDTTVLERAEYFSSFPDTAMPLGDRWHLNPAMCYHVYQRYEHTTLSGNVCIYVAGQSFRNERSYAYLRRMGNFTMAEIVSLGDSRQVESFRTSLLLEVARLAEKLGLRGSLDRARDPFFVSAANRGKIVRQKLSPLKFELNIRVGKRERLAVASFNNHQEFFGSRFHIVDPDDLPVHSACVAFGIERWIYAYLYHHGLNRKNWPKIAI
jgi:seryl-tRNA synthetase